jgi:hypothetical protein
MVTSAGSRSYRRCAVPSFEPLDPRVMLSAARAKPPAPAVDPVIEWNQVLIDVLRADRTLPGPGYSSRSAAMMHLAIYDAVESVERNYEPYLAEAKMPRSTSIDAAVAAAGWRVLTEIYPDQKATLDAALATTLARVKDGPNEDRGVRVGLSCGSGMMDDRTGDHAYDVTPYTASDAVGHWQPSPPDFTPAWGPGWGFVTPFAMEAATQFDVPPPPALESSAYAAAYDQVKSLGAKNSTTRTAEQTQIGHFWAYDRAGTGTPPALYNQVVETIAIQQHNTVEQNARLFALANAAMADAGVAAWEVKFRDDFWRPVTAIRQGDADGNPLTAGDATWEPLGAPAADPKNDFTPPFPAYVSGHATFGGAVFRVLQDFYGTDDIHFTLKSDELPGVTRSFDHFSDAAEENGMSRIFLGIHWNFDSTQGIALGRQIADFVFAHDMSPIKNASHDATTTVVQPMFVAFDAAPSVVTLMEKRPDDLI